MDEAIRGGDIEDIGVHVSYAEPERALVKAYRLRFPATVQDAIRRASDDPYFAGVDLHSSAVGVFGEVALPGRTLRDGDRVEIYRPLAADPKNARRERVRAARDRAARGEAARGEAAPTRN